MTLNVLPLGSYYILIRMDWLENHLPLVNFRDKNINLITDEDARHKIQGIKRNIKLRPITINHFVKCIRKGCQIYVVQAGYNNFKDKLTTFGNILVIQEFVDVFPE